MAHCWWACHGTRWVTAQRQDKKTKGEMLVGQQREEKMKHEEQ